jgi:hypothetical protein
MLLFSFFPRMKIERARNLNLLDWLSMVLASQCSVERVGEQMRRLRRTLRLDQLSQDDK